METIFDIEKKYILYIRPLNAHPKSEPLKYYGIKVRSGGGLLTFIDKFSEQQVYPTSCLVEAKEAREVH